MAKYRICSKIKATNKVIEGGYVIDELQADKFRIYIERENASQTEIVYSLEQEPSKLPRTRRPSATMAKRNKGD
jgi:hypothetical protein